MHDRLAQIAAGTRLFGEMQERTRVSDTGRPRSVVVVDTASVEFLENRMFNREYAKRFPGLEMLVDLACALKIQGVEAVTADLYLNNPSKWGSAALLSFETTDRTAPLIGAGVIPAVCLSLESPIYAREFYRAIPGVSGLFGHVFLWRGTRERVVGARFHEIHWPYPTFDGCPIPGSDWKSRQFLVMVSSNKLAYPRPRPLILPANPRATAGNLRMVLQLMTERYSDPWFRSEYHSRRLSAIRHFAGKTEFDLYGRGWGTQRTLLSRRDRRAVDLAYRGELPPDAKIATTSRYRFALCFENTTFPGYLTEKIFDAFAAGVVPVYLGAPDIAVDVPADSFVDVRSFRGFPELDEFLAAMTEERAHQYLAAARRFMSSDASATFVQARLIQELVSALVGALR